MTPIYDEDPRALCSVCREEEKHTIRVSRRATSMLPLEFLKLAHLCERCGGRKSKWTQF